MSSTWRILQVNKAVLEGKNLIILLKRHYSFLACGYRQCTCSCVCVFMCVDGHSLCMCRCMSVEDQADIRTFLYHSPLSMRQDLWFESRAYLLCQSAQLANPRDSLFVKLQVNHHVHWTCMWVLAIQPSYLHRRYFICLFISLIHNVNDKILELRSGQWLPRTMWSEGSQSCKRELERSLYF